jgi:hypothetical protein
MESGMAADITDESQPAKPVSLSDSVHRIPGIGIVRARALEKAGYSTLAQVKSLKVENLTAIRGISEIKAQQILDYVGSVRPAVQRSRRAPVLRAPVSAPAPTPPPSNPAVLDALVREAATEVSTVTANLLRSPASAQFDKRLARQLGKLAFFSERVAANGLPTGANAERFASQLNKIKDLLAALFGAPPGGPKKQEKIADKLRSARKELQDAS